MLLTPVNFKVVFKANLLINNQWFYANPFTHFNEPHFNNPINDLNTMNPIQ